jgi:flagellar hook-associated protein 2
MALSTNLISGLASGIDWRTMVDQLIAIEHKPVDLMTTKKTETEAKLKEWQGFNTKLLALKTAVEAINKPRHFNVYTASLSADSTTVDGEDILSVTASEYASTGSYSLKVTNLAKAQKLSSNPFTSQTAALGASYAGDIVINGKVATIGATDSLLDVAETINGLNSGSDPSGVTASVVKFGASDYRLILTSDTTGAEGITLKNGATTDLVQRFGWKDGLAASVNHAITGGAQGDGFSSSTVSIQSLIGLTTGESGSVTIGDKSVAIDLSTMSLTDIKNAINAAAPTGVSASVVSETVNGETMYRLQIDGTQTFTDTENILNTLGVLDHTSTDVSGKISGNAMTVNGARITASSVIKNIDGYNTFTTGDYVTLSGTDTSGGVVDANFTITSSTTVQDLLDEIETRFGNVLAYVTSDGKIRVDDLSGGSSLAVNLTDHVQASGSSLEFVAGDANFSAATARKREIVAGEDAVVEVDGVEITSSDNVIDDVIAGVTLNLVKEDATTTVSLNIGRDLDGIKKKLEDFVTKYNDVVSFINMQSSYDVDAQKKGGVLFGDGTIHSVRTDLVSSLTASVWGVSSQFSIPGLVGIKMDNTSLLSIDDSVLTGYLKTNFNDVVSLFTGRGTTSSSDLQYVTHSRASKAGEYTVRITNAATQSASTSATAVAATLGAGETLTITSGGQTATVALTAAMTIDDIVNAVNEELDTAYTQTLAGAESLYSDAGHTTAITESTTWSGIYDGTGAAANIADGDVITFSGTSRSGGTLSGSYTIDDAGTDTVKGLLSAIETTFGNNVTASIDTAGRIVVTDRQSGTSSLALTLDTSGAHDLDFGTTATSNTGGAQGRYAMSITASADAGDHLVLTHDNYGSDHTFTISETADLLWSGDQIVANGEDVAGTINGEAATGSGQVLTGDEGDTNVEGLAVLYSGTAENVDAGTVKLTVGTADIFSRSLYYITDAYDGYVDFKLDSLQDTIDDYETKIAAKEALLGQRQENMIKRFVVMETALSRIQSQSNWLQSQLDNL